MTAEMPAKITLSDTYIYSVLILILIKKVLDKILTLIFKMVRASNMIT